MVGSHAARIGQEQLELREAAGLGRCCFRQVFARSGVRSGQQPVKRHHVIASPNPSEKPGMLPADIERQIVLEQAGRENGRAEEFYPSESQPLLDVAGVDHSRALGDDDWVAGMSPLLPRLGLNKRSAG